MNYLEIYESGQDLKYPGVFGLEHIIFLVIYFLLFALGIFFVLKIKNDEKKTNIVIKISAICLLIAILLNRFFIALYETTNKDETWLKLIPNSFCGLTSLLFSLAILFGKKDNKFLHFLTYLGFLGGLVTMFYPDFLDTQLFIDPRTLTGLIHHAIMLWLSIILIITSYIKPDIKKWYYFPIGIIIYHVIGVIEIKVFKFSGAMQIHDPFISEIPVLSSWYVLAVLETVFIVAFLFVYKKLKKDKSN